MTNTRSITEKLHSRGARVLLAAGAIAAAAIAATPAANATDFRGAAPAGNPSYIQVHSSYQDNMLSEYEVRHYLRTYGYNRIESISYVPGAYVAQAWRYGRLTNLRIDPYNGRIIGQSYVQARQYHQPHGYGSYRNSHSHGGYRSHGRGYGIYFGF
jgi:hypothetical protein